MKDEQIIEGNRLIAELLHEQWYVIFNDGSILGKKGRFIKLHKGTSGYLQLNIGRKPTKSYLVHRLVAELYLPNPDGLPEVNHKDGNKANNRVANLEWCTRNHNIQHGVDNGLIPSPWKGKSGHQHCRSKTVLQMDINNNIIHEYGSAREAARLSKVNYGTISFVLIGKGKTAGGFKWKYKN